VTTHLRPGDGKALADMVGFLASRKAPTEVIGAGTKRLIGKPISADYLLDVSKIAGIHDYEPSELVMTCGAGTPLWVIESALADANQQLAFEPIDYGPLLGGPQRMSTIGGALATNASGPRRFKVGAARDHFLGAIAVSGRGEEFKAGGKVVKNVTGYDLCKLLAGSWGTLAVMHEVTVKVLPAPEETATLVLHGLGLKGSVAAMTLALQSPHEVSGAAYLPAEDETLLRIEGFPDSVRARMHALQDLLRPTTGESAVLDRASSLDRWLGIRDVAPLHGIADAPIWRLSLQPSSASDVWNRVMDGVGEAGFIDWGGGLIWLAAAPELSDAGAQTVRETLARHGGGHATLIRGSAALRSRVAVFPQPSAGANALQGRIRNGFDPHGIFNPGRVGD
jgi:glycolate oxidase FAD binding subunit